MNQIKFLVAILTAVAFTTTTRAEKPELPESYTKASSDGRFLFVMLVPPRYSKEDSQRGANLQKRYPRSGLYRNDGSSKPLWDVGGGYARKAYPASDGVHLVCVSGYGGGFEPWGQAIRFYAAGQLMRAYSIDDLTVPWLLRDSPSGTIWLCQDRFDDAEQRYTIWTSDGNSLTFDVRTGEIVSKFVLLRWAAGILLAVSAVGLIAWFVVRRHRRAVPAS
jgi:hypothetical protein